ncbi:MAG TPA: efflux RND transporter periplasmic adaptor subunit [Desulfosporosinus sp.]|nr:efflux RND transporter periplasmic adaptor subunit [Desulfosporosinus sp.]
MENKFGKKGKKVLIIIASVLAILALVFIGRGLMSKPIATVVEEKYIPVEVEVVAKQTLINTAILSGKISSDTDVAVIPKVPGKVMTVNVKVGDTVSKGAVLLTIDTSDIQKQVDTMRATLQSAEVGNLKSKEQWDMAKSSLERTKLLAADKIANSKQTLANTKVLYEAGAVSKDQLDQAELALKELESTFAAQIEQLENQTLDSSLQLAEAQLNQAQVGYNQALQTLNDAVVTAPVDGIVSQVDVTVGNMAAIGQSAVSLTNKDSLYSSISVAENLVNRLTTGKAVKVTIPSVSEEGLVGKIEYISPSADPKTQLYPLKISVENSDGLIKPGMFSKVELTTEEKPDVMAAKSESVVLRNGKTIVYIVQGDKAVAKEVVTGLDTGVEIEITKGLNLGDKVIIKGQTLVDEGHKVKIVGGDAS